MHTTATSEETASSSPSISQHAAPPPPPPPAPTTTPLSRTKTPNSLLRTISVLSRVPTSVPNTPAPDGGRQAWQQVLACHLAMASCWGVLMCWGVYQSYYTSTLLPTYDQSTVSWIGSVQVTLVFLVGILSGRLTDNGFFYHVMYAGLFLEVLGVFATSVSGPDFARLFLAQGLCFGLGTGLTFTPMVALLSTYFEKKRTLAIAVAASGASTGGVIFPSVLRQLIPQVGFGWAVRVVAFLVLLFNVTCALLLKWRLTPRTSGPWWDRSAFSDRAFIGAVLAMFFAMWAVYVAFFYVGVYARTEIGLDYEQSVDLLLVMVATGVPGRVGFALIADRYLGPMTTLVPVLALSALMLFVWITVRDMAGMYVVSALYGIGGAALQSLFPSLMATLSPNVNLRGTRIGMAFFVAALAVLSGPPIAGELIRRNNGAFFAAQLWAGMSMIAGLGLIIYCRVAKVGWSFKTKI